MLTRYGRAIGMTDKSNLISGPKAATPEGILENTERLLAQGKPGREATAIAYHIAENERADNDSR